MAKKKATNKRTAMSKSEISSALKGVTGDCRSALDQLAKEGRRVQVVGRVKNGKVEFDRASMDKFARKFPEANMTFVAVNAPFDPQPLAQ